jgi:multimeric flavodoxin WrbA
MDMKITLISGTNHKGSTYHAAKMAAETLGRDITEFFLPRDMPHFCAGCGTCFEKSEALCPHFSYIDVIVKSMEAADVLIFTSPVYVYHCSGQMKAFLDHLGYQWIVHRPNASMFNKTALVVSTAAGAGLKSTCRDISHSLTMWGVKRIYTLKCPVMAIRWQNVSDKIKQKIECKAKKAAGKIKASMKKTIPNLKTLAWFYMMRFVNKKFPFNETDRAHWEKQGLLHSNPWNKSYSPPPCAKD